MRISKRVREEAIEACEFCAALCDRSESGYGGIAVMEIYSANHADEAVAGSLACEAWCAVTGLNVHDDGESGPWWGGLPRTSKWWVATYLEAAALLRDGWNPGEPVVLLKGGR